MFGAHPGTSCESCLERTENIIDTTIITFAPNTFALLSVFPEPVRRMNIILALLFR